MGCLYKIDFPSGKSYIGITMKTAEQRFKGHCKKKNEPSALGAALTKYGSDSARVKTLVVTNDWKYLCDLEKKAIVAFNTKSPHGYNMTEGGDGTNGYEFTPEDRLKMSSAGIGRTFTKDHRSKISAALKGRNVGNKFKKGHTPTEETISKLSRALKGREFSDEWRRNLSAAAKGNKHLLGHKHSEETRQKLRDAWARRKGELK